MLLWLPGVGEFRMVAGAGQDRDVDGKPRIFISYSRRDMAFADRLEATLKARGFVPLIDREEIYAFEDWWKRIEALIGQADTVVFVLSPDAVSSRVALKEVEYAASLHKRFAPIVCRRVESSALPEALRRLNFIFFDNPERFDASADALASALETDINWIRQHTEYGQAERRWSSADRPNGLLLQPPTLDLAEYWLASRPRNAPDPTEEIRSYVMASRAHARASQRLRRAVLASIITLLVGVIVGLVALDQSVLHRRAMALVDRHAAVCEGVQVLASCADCRAGAGAQAGKCVQGVRAGLPGHDRRSRRVVHDGSAGSIEKPQHTVTIRKALCRMRNMS